MTRRYFAPQLPEVGGLVPLDEAECHHAVNVMRVREGEPATLFDGAGGEALATFVSVNKREVLCETQPKSRPNRENSVTVVLGVAMPKGDRAKELIERLTELGVNELVPLHCERTQWEVPSNAIGKWKRIVIDACKQCGRNQLMHIASPRKLRDWLSDEALRHNVRYLAHPAKETESATTETPEALAVAIAIGPEGGFTDLELEHSDAHKWQRLSLGHRVYRIETAAIVATVKLAKL